MWARVLKDFVVSALIFAPLAAQARAAVELETELDAVTEIRPDFNPALAADLSVYNTEVMSGGIHLLESVGTNVTN